MSENSKILTDEQIEVYKQCVDTFHPLMLKELIANDFKGGREGKHGWLTCNPREMLSEIYYHTGKLQEAIRDKNIEQIKEYSSDIANLAMMMVDIHESLIKP